MSKKTILVVDDVVTNLDLLNGLLAQLYNVKVAKNGIKALELARQDPKPSLILLDIMMPNMNGFQVCSTLKASSETSNIPIIFLSAKNQVEDEMEGFNIGGVDYVAKPFNPKLLLTRINTHIELCDKRQELEDALSKLADSHAKIVEQEKMASLGYLISGVAHEVNTPLGLCKTASSNLFDLLEILKEMSLEDSLDKKSFTECLDDIFRSKEIISSNLDKLIELIANFKEAAVYQNTYEKKEFDIVTYLSSVAPFLIYGEDNSEVKLTIKPNTPLKIKSYPAIFIQIFKNLILNSLQHAFADTRNPHITINIALEDSSLLIRYSDNGSGIARKEHDKIFDPFYTTDRFHGSKGLGLFIVYILVTKHLNGTIKILDSEKGANFMITLPMRY